jgi:hypothetical protein
MDKQTLIKIAFVVCLLAIFGLIFSISNTYSQQVIKAMQKECQTKYNGTYVSHDSQTFTCLTPHSNIKYIQVGYNLSYK